RRDGRRSARPGRLPDPCDRQRRRIIGTTDSGSSMGTDTPAAPAKPASQYTRTNPFPGKLTVNRSLCGEGTEKDTRHFEIDLTGWGLNYEVGDSMTVWPTNDPVLADEIIQRLGA